MEQATIAIVDDDKIFQWAMKRTVEITNVFPRVLQFHDAKEAIDFFTMYWNVPGALPRVIFLDINMQHTDAWEFLDTFQSLQTRSGTSYTPAIYVLSSSNNPEDISKAGKYTILSGYLTKPVEQQRLIEILNKASYSG